MNNSKLTTKNSKLNFLEILSSFAHQKIAVIGDLILDKYIYGKVDRISPEAPKNANPAWFAFIITLKEGIPFSRDELTSYLNTKLIETRVLFAGNITKQPGFIDENWSIADHLNNTDYIMNNTFSLGTYPG